MPAVMITMQEMTEELGRLVAARRDAIGMTQDELAARIGSKQSYVSQLEKGKIGLPGIKRLSQISFALGVSISELLMNSSWPDVSDYVAELEAMQRGMGSLTGKRAEIARRMYPLSDEMIEKLDEYVEFLERTDKLHQLPGVPGLMQRDR